MYITISVGKDPLSSQWGRPANLHQSHLSPPEQPRKKNIERMAGAPTQAAGLVVGGDISVQGAQEDHGYHS